MRLFLALLALLCVSGCRKFLFGDSESDPAPAAPAPAAPTPAPPPAPPPPVACGDDGQPECPLQAWMDRTMNDAMTTKSAPALEQAFVQLATFEPPEFSEWSEFAEIGRSAAARGDLGTVGRICTACHDKYRPRYRKEVRGRALPTSAGTPAKPAQ